MNINIKLLEAEEIPSITAAFAGDPWNAPAVHFEDYLAEQACGKREILVAHSKKDIAGYVTIKWYSDYPPFAAKETPEINDLRVLPAFRRRGIASALVDEAERRIFERSPRVGIGVGMYADYGPAQRMYVLRGYVPDGLGLCHRNESVVPGQHVPVDDDLILYFIKERR